MSGAATMRVVMCDVEGKHTELSLPLGPSLTLESLRAHASQHLACGDKATLVVVGGGKDRARGRTQLTPDLPLDHVLQDGCVVLCTKRRGQGAAAAAGQGGGAATKGPTREEVQEATAKLVEQRDKEEVDKDNVLFNLQLLQSQKARFRTLVKLLEPKWQAELAKRRQAPEQHGEDEEVRMEDLDVDDNAVRLLMDTGFPKNRCIKALVFAGTTELAMEWLLEHIDDQDADKPLTRKDVKNIAAKAAKTAVDRIMEMGFTEADAVMALAVCNNEESVACSLLLGDVDPLFGAGFELTHPLLSKMVSDTKTQEHLLDPRVREAMLKLLDDPSILDHYWKQDDKVHAALLHMLSLASSLEVRE